VAPKFVLRTLKSKILIVPSGLISALEFDVPILVERNEKSRTLTMPSQLLVSPVRGQGLVYVWAWREEVCVRNKNPMINIVNFIFDILIIVSCEICNVDRVF